MLLNLDIPTGKAVVYSLPFSLLGLLLIWHCPGQRSEGSPNSFHLEQHLSLNVQQTIFNIDLRSHQVTSTDNAIAFASKTDRTKPTPRPSSPDRNILRLQSETAKSPRAERKLQHVSSLLVNPNVKLPAVSLADYTSRSRLCWLRNNKYFPFASLRGNKTLFLRR